MIAEAQRQALAGVAFEVGSAESLDDLDRYDAILCNSAFQWFHDPPSALANCLAALRSGGRMAIQAPARSDYCPNFIQAVGTLRSDPRTRGDFDRFRSPWFFLESADAYARVFTDVGFAVEFSEITTVREQCTPAHAHEVFESGAAAGYLNAGCYPTPPSPDYFPAARALIARQLQSQAIDGVLELTFFRIYLLARKP
jgi:trans-aconitate methyltransferase